MLKLIFYVPESHLEQTKQAVFAAGAGKYSNYEQCAWQVLGNGQFRPGQGSNPYLGELHQLTMVAEYRVETICTKAKIEQVIQALKQAHPYENPAYEAWELNYYSSI
jgi:hypothetical protein